ncbi:MULTISPECIES: heparan-alpha-glucosaminide N-acetyltransferase domain-containing protein [unclassified Algibacter]|uniref:heparan-alpha-glucosaminide N-acetyltransferase domain-containing protein n=1 Tax=unclassified Algibacter TaxID=2615009 RepID=UPI0018EF31DE|nr:MULTISPECIES: heparan-alpha-glucosaminide N-acetyltransferase domain-containing protein [unclassified Algibacter]MCL5128937.1 DUF1624 domain-containing protein [Algibacter sp. L4_22]
MQANRIYFIDAVRAFAILMMLQGHFIHNLLTLTYRDNNNLIYNIWEYFRGFTAPTFFTISGLVFSYLLLRAHAKGDDKPRIKKGLFRGLLLLVIGYSLRLDIFNWLKGDFDTHFFAVDVLQCIGLGLITLAGLHILFKKYNYLFSFVLFTLGCICFITEPLYRNLELTNTPLFLANYITTKNGSIFTILPWIGYSFFGAFLSTVFFRHLHRKHFKLLTISTFFITGYFLIFQSSIVLIKLHLLTNIDLFKECAYYNYLFTRLGDTLILFGVFYSLERFLRQSLITRIGEKTLSIYVIHFIILYGSFTGLGLNRFLRKSLDPTQAILGAILFMIVVCFIAFYYAKTNAFIYNLIRKLSGEFKN